MARKMACGLNGIKMGKKLQSENYKDGKGEHEETPTRLKMETSEENENKVKESK
jgi:hypothetical protein